MTPGEFGLRYRFALLGEKGAGISVLSKAVVALDMRAQDWADLTGDLRMQRDLCCKHCRALKGKGPWCERCGLELPGADHDSGWAGPCPSCETQLREGL